MGGEGPRSVLSKERPMTSLSDASSGGVYCCVKDLMGMGADAVLVALGDLLVDELFVTLLVGLMLRVVDDEEAVCVCGLSTSPSSEEPARRSRSSRRRLSFLPMSTDALVSASPLDLSLESGTTYDSCAGQCGFGCGGAQQGQKSWSSPHPVEPSC